MRMKESHRQRLEKLPLFTIEDFVLWIRCSYRLGVLVGRGLSDCFLFELSATEN